MNTHIPGWISYRLSDIYTERKEPGNESLPLLTVSIHSGVSDGELDEDELPKKVKRIEDKSQYKRAATGDLVFNMMRAWQGAIGTVRTEGMVSPAYIVAKPNGKVYPPFMDYYMKAPRMVGMINRQSYGVTDFRKRLYWDSFAPIPCVLPPVREQKRIAEILSTQDKAIELQARKIEELKRFKKGCLEKMFPRKGQKVPEKRFPGFTDDWEQRKLGNVASYRRGSFPQPYGKSEWYDGDGAMPFVQVADVSDEMNLVENTKQKISILAQPMSVFAGKNSVLVTLQGSIGRVAITQYGAFVDRTVLIFEKYKEKIDTTFWAYIVKQKFIDEAQKAPGGTIKTITKEALSDFDLSIPNYKEQQQIGAFFKQLDNLITLHQRKLEEMKNQKKALMQLLLTGIVRI